MSEPHVVVVDGSNLATEGRTTPSLQQLDEAVQAYAAEVPDAEIVVVVDASFEHRVESSERAALEEAELHGEVVSPPAGAIGRGDAFVLRIAERTGASVLSNDSFQEFHGEHPWLFDEGRLVGGKPVPGIGWIFTRRIPVRGPKSRQATSKARRAVSSEPLSPPVKAAELAKAARKAAARRMALMPDGTTPKVGDVWRAPTAPPAGPEEAPGGTAEDAAPADGTAPSEGTAPAGPARKRGGARKGRGAKKATATAVTADEPGAVGGTADGGEDPSTVREEPVDEAPGKKATAKKKAAAKKAPAKKTGAEKAVAEKAPAKKAVAKKAVAKKAPAKRTGAKKAPAKRTGAEKAVAKKAPASAAAAPEDVRSEGVGEAIEAEQSGTPEVARPAREREAAHEAPPVTSRRGTQTSRPREDPALRHAIDEATAEALSPPVETTATTATAAATATATTGTTAAELGGGPDGGGNGSSGRGARRRRRRAATSPPAVNEPLAFITFVASCPIGGEVEGEVVSFTSHGAMIDVDLPDGGTLHCYIPLAAMADPPPTKARQVLSRGERRAFVLAGLDPPRRVAELAIPGVAEVSPEAAGSGG
ncbi:MAG: NYN domain-containing protein [Acidimicrobiales bacterium]